MAADTKNSRATRYLRVLSLMDRHVERRVIQGDGGAARLDQREGETELTLKPRRVGELPR